MWRNAMYFPHGPNFMMSCCWGHAVFSELTREEKIVWLKSYKSRLEDALDQVEKELARLELEKKNSTGEK